MRRVHGASTVHMHLAWESQPLVGSAPRPRSYARRIVALAFVLGLLAGLLI